jgi:hypothetical protein
MTDDYPDIIYSQYSLTPPEEKLPLWIGCSYSIKGKDRLEVIRSAQDTDAGARTMPLSAIWEML